MSDFDSRARDWDKEMRHVERSLAISVELLKTVPLNKNMKALEFGAGTGLLSFILKDRFAEITMMDNSMEMVKVAQEKITAAKAHNMNAICIDLEKENHSGEFDIVYTQMVMHHVLNIDVILGKFYSLLKKDGYLAIADLYSEDGSFHGADFKGHNGFDMENLSSVLKDKGFVNIKHKHCYNLKKNISSGELKEFPIFLLVASK
ncbi:MAG: methyltransferase domain-containing protein [Lentisphaerae bacterium]|nr:methyltransferase domain-containing protein [Lentisphaerota bacterium]